MSKDGQDSGLGFFISFLRWLAGWWTQTRLSEETGIARSNLNKYENGKKEPRPSTLRTITEAVGVPERLVGFLRLCLRLIQKALAIGRGLPADSSLRGEAGVAARDILERAMALARAECGLLAAAPRPPGPMTRQERERAETLFEKLSPYSISRQQLLIRGSRAYKDPFLALLLCEKSEVAAPHDPNRALELAELALYIAQNVQDADLRPRLEGWCTGFAGNVQRSVGKEISAAGNTFDRAWHLWRQGKDPASLLSEARLLHLEVSLRREQRQFPRARKLLDRALDLARPEEKGAILLSKGYILQEEGKHEEALHVLEEAEGRIAGEQQPRVGLELRFEK